MTLELYLLWDSPGELGQRTRDRQADRQTGSSRNSEQHELLEPGVVWVSPVQLGRSTSRH